MTEMNSTANKAPTLLRDEAEDVGDSAGGDPTVVVETTVKANF